MPGSKKPRKPYQRKPGGLPVTIRFSESDARTLKLIPHQCLDAIRRGAGVEQDWHTLAARVNLGAVMSLKFPEYEALQRDMKIALDALRAIRDRGRYDMAGGDELKAIGVALNLVDEMQDGTTRRDLAEAMTDVYRSAAIW